MSGTFDKEARPALAGSYFNWEAEAPQDAPVVPAAGIVALVGTADWGPINSFVRITSPARFRSVFGSNETSLKRAADRLFAGQALPGQGGASELIVYRRAAAAAKAATVTLQNTTPAAALRLTARYTGTRGNALRVTVQASATVGKKELLLLDGTAVLETYTFTGTDVDDLVAQINALSGFVTAERLVNGVAIADAASQALTTGDDGATLTNTDHVAIMAALEARRFGILAVPNVADDATITAYAAWTRSVNLRGKRVKTVLGGPDNDALTAVGARARAINWPDVSIIGGSVIRHVDTGLELQPADQVALYAASLAGRGESADQIFVRFAGYELVSGPDLAGQEYAVANGFVVFSQDTNAAAPVFIREGVTTYTDDSQSPKDRDGNKTMPVGMYRREKVVATQHAVETEADEFATSGSTLGRLPVDDESRAVVLGFIKGLLQTRVDNRIIQPGFTVELDRDPEPTDSQDFIQYRWGFRPTRSLRQLFHTARIG